MLGDVVVLREGDPRCRSLTTDGWMVTARSWAARLDVGPQHIPTWRAAVARLGVTDIWRELNEDDVPAALALDAATTGDYPGGVATAHEALTAATAMPNEQRRGFGVFDGGRQLVAMTFVDIEAEGERAEVDFTVVVRHRRRQGLATAVKAASLLALSHRGVTLARTGGSDENHGILAVNRALGFCVDERWLTMAAPVR
jgi:GNAT superfamily N-acetyltransferase